MIRPAINMLLLVCIVMPVIFGCAGLEQEAETNVSYRLHTFYYPWYGNEEFDSELRHWNHQVLGIDSQDSSFPGYDNIGANFYPEAGCYSSNDPEVVKKHMTQLSRAGIGVIVVSWWGQGSFEDKTIPLILKSANEHDLKVCFHIEPFENRDYLSVRDAICYLNKTYGDNPAFYRWEKFENRPVFYIYDSYSISPEDWAKILQPDGEATIRGTEDDAVVLGLWIAPNDGQKLLKGGFDGFYSYFAIDGFSYASSRSNWPSLQNWADEHEMIFIPCVAPGYDDSRIRPWNSRNIKLREGGKYYDDLFSSAITVIPDCIAITSFNEWHEGTQIEPAISKSIDGYTYSDYQPQPEDYYLTRTRYWKAIFEVVADQNDLGEFENLLKGYLPEEPERRWHLALASHIGYSTYSSPQYHGGSSQALINGKLGSTYYRDGRWQGFEGNDCRITLTFDSPVDVNKIAIGCLNDPDAWIFYPDEITVSLSSNPPDYVLLPPVYPEECKNTEKTYFTFECDVDNITKIDICIKNVKTCPNGHPGAGGKAWLFIDEVIVE